MLPRSMPRTSKEGDLTTPAQPLAANPIAFLASNSARGLTEFLRLLYSLSGVDVQPQPTCLNSICALPASSLVIDSTTFQRTLTQGLTVLLWILAAAAVLLAAQAILRAAASRTGVARVLRKAVTGKTVAIALACAVALSAGVAVLSNLRALSRYGSPFGGHGMGRNGVMDRWATSGPVADPLPGAHDTSSRSPWMMSRMPRVSRPQ